MNNYTFQVTPFKFQATPYEVATPRLKNPILWIHKQSRFRGTGNRTTCETLKRLLFEIHATSSWLPCFFKNVMI